MKPTIDKLPVEMYRTIHKKDAYGNRIKDKEKYIGYKRLKCVETGPRIGHFLIDVICFQVIYSIFGSLLQLLALFLSKDPVTILSVGLAGTFIGLLLWPLYYFMFEFFLQRTPGKYVTKTIVVNEYGEKPDAATTILRTVIRLVPFEAFSCFSDSNRGWHDRWSKTYVLTLKEHQEVQALMEKYNTADAGMPA
ncbi:MAG: hypothetical protein JWO09_3542 [Bacteroidetes bacterium]|nr:hypothetical protein [Bacteroidota bacterium]